MRLWIALWLSDHLPLRLPWPLSGWVNNSLARFMWTTPGFRQ